MHMKTEFIVNNIMYTASVQVVWHYVYTAMLCRRYGLILHSTKLIQNVDNLKFSSNPDNRMCECLFLT